MADEISKSHSDFIQRAGKEMVCCLLPDELPYFDMIWEVLEPILKDPVFYSADESKLRGLYKNRFSGLAFASDWSTDVQFLIAHIIMILGKSLEKAVEQNFYNEEQICDLVGKANLCWPLPDRFLRMITLFVADVCGAFVDTDEETQNMLEKTKILLPHGPCYCVFHHGDNHFYVNELPAEVHQLRERVRFWLYRQKKEYLSFSHDRYRHRFGPQTEHVLRFLCSSNNAGKTVSFSELYSKVWKKPPLSTYKMVRSIEVAASELNRFALETFECQDKKVKEAKVFRIRGMDKYEIKKDTPDLCCIIRSFSLPK